MYEDLLLSLDDQLVRDQLNLLATELRQRHYTTREDCLAEVVSEVNRVLDLAGSMEPLSPVIAGAPALPGDLNDNLDRLNRGAVNLTSRLEGIEDAGSRLYNLAAASQNALRQQIREMILASTPRRYRENFLNQNGLGQVTATLDYNVGSAYLPILSDEPVSIDSIALGASSLGTGGDPVSLLQGSLNQVFVFSGVRLELLLGFAQPVVANRLQVELDDYESLTLSSWTCSADGSVFEDLLADRGVSELEFGATSGKYSGDVLLDFNPRYVSSMRLVFEDRVGSTRIALRSLKLSARKFASSGQLSSVAIVRPAGSVRFISEEFTSSPFTAISHQISADGLSYTAIHSGDVLTLSSPYWYRALLLRPDASFQAASTPLADPEKSSNYRLESMNTLPSGNNLVERVLVLSDITGPVHFRDLPILSTLRIQEGTRLLAASEYALSDGYLSFPGPKTQVVVSYQTSQLGPASVALLREYYSPVLSQIIFESLA